MVDPTLKQLNDNILMNFLMERLKYFVMINKCSRFLCKYCVKSIFVSGKFLFWKWRSM